MPPAPASPATTPPPSKKKKKKIAVLPPPAELEAEALLRAQAKANAKNKKKTSKKPLTTKDKIAASAVGRKKKQAAGSIENDGDGLKAAGGRSKGAKGDSGAAKGEKPRNLMDIMRDLGQMSSAAAPTPVKSTVAGKVQTVAGSGRGGHGKGKAKAKESVLVRPTERTKRMKQSQLHQAGTSKSSPPVAIKQEDDNESPPSAHGSLMDLPLEVRQRIWRLAVVETQFFVYPAIDQEQPDLAMTSRQVRSEVLPLFYGENTFAIEIPASAGVESGTKKARVAERVSLEPVKKWMSSMADKDYVQTIGNWAFSWAPPLTDVGAGAGESGDREVIVSIRYPMPASADRRDVQPEVEIHQQAFCLLESHKLFNPCLRRCYPRWLDDTVAAAVLAGGSDRGQQMMLIANDVEKRGGELVGSRCGDENVE